MYRQFSQQNPKVVGLPPILLAIYILQLIYTLWQLYDKFKQIDKILLMEYKVKKSDGTRESKFSPELADYLDKLAAT